MRQIIVTPARSIAGAWATILPRRERPFELLSVSFAASNTDPYYLRALAGDLASVVWEVSAFMSQSPGQQLTFAQGGSGNRVVDDALGTLRDGLGPLPLGCTITPDMVLQAFHPSGGTVISSFCFQIDWNVQNWLPQTECYEPGDQNG